MDRQFEISDFVDSIEASEPKNTLSVNVYENSILRDNLTLWLTTYDPVARTALFVGEAPGIKGARLTGVPFTSPAILSSCKPDPWGVFRSAAGFQVPEGTNVAQSENTATIFWKAMRRYFTDLPRPLTWNAYPFWAHEEGGFKNRTPSDEELRFGHKWLRDIVEMHPNAMIVAVGRKAEKALGEIGFGAEYVRHPANGGGPDFDAGVKRISGLLR